ncbi:MAG: ester cyclase [bacterium]
MKSRFFLLALAVTFMAVGCQKKEGAPDMAMNAKADSMKTAYKAVSDAWDAGKTDQFDKYITTNMVDHDPMPGQKPGLAGMKDMVAMMKTSFPDMKSTVDYMGVDGDILTVRFHMAATNSGAMMGMPPTGKKVNVQGIDQMRWENGKFVEHWGVFDAMGMMQQMGLMPSHDGMPPPPDGAAMAKPEEKKK